MKLALIWLHIVVYGSESVYWYLYFQKRNFTKEYITHDRLEHVQHK